MNRLLPTSSRRSDAKFDYPFDAEDEFSPLFTSDVPVDDGFDWFEPTTSLTVGSIASTEETIDV